MPEDLASLWVYWGKCDLRRNNQASRHPRGGSLNGDNSDQLPRGKLPVSIQRCPRQITVKSPQSCHICSLLDDEIHNYDRDRSSPRKILGLKRMLQ